MRRVSWWSHLRSIATFSIGDQRRRRRRRRRRRGRSPCTLQNRGSDQGTLPYKHSEVSCQVDFRTRLHDSQYGIWNQWWGHSCSISFVEPRNFSVLKLYFQITLTPWKTLALWHKYAIKNSTVHAYCLSNSGFCNFLCTLLQNQYNFRCPPLINWRINERRHFYGCFLTLLSQPGCVTRYKPRLL